MKMQLSTLPAITAPDRRKNTSVLRPTLLAVFCCLFLVPAVQAQLDSDATVYLSDGSVRDAILLHASDTAIIVDFSMQSWARNTVPPLDEVFLLHPSQVDSVYCHGVQYSWFRSFLGGFFGAIYGFFPGAIVGAGLAAASTETNSGTGFGIAFAGAFAGMIVGAILGSSGGDEEELPPAAYSPQLSTSLGSLRTYCLYKDKKPRFLQSIMHYSGQN